MYIEIKIGPSSHQELVRYVKIRSALLLLKGLPLPYEVKTNDRYGLKNRQMLHCNLRRFDEKAINGTLSLCNIESRSSLSPKTNS